MKPHRRRLAKLEARHFDCQCPDCRKSRELGRLTDEELDRRIADLQQKLAESERREPANRGRDA